MNEPLVSFSDPLLEDSSSCNPRLIGKVYENKLQFEEAVQRLLEEFEKHPHPQKGVCY